jgi:small subunit ribosomal protein S9
MTTIDIDTTTTTAAPSPQPKPQRVKTGKGGYTWGTGRRKTAVARVRVRPGSGKFIVNDKPVDEFFNEMRDREDVKSPLRATKTEGKLDVLVTVMGGGYTGQAGAVLLGLARALKGYDPALEPILRENDYLTRDPREVERKKYGQPGARRRFQFSKR